VLCFEHWIDGIRDARRLTAPDDRMTLGKHGQENGDGICGANPKGVQKIRGLRDAAGEFARKLSVSAGSSRLPVSRNSSAASSAKRAALSMKSA
jgi:hypothetical protein